MKAPTIGELNTRVTFQQPIVSADNAGGQNVVWQPYATRWSAVKAVQATEASNDAAIRAQTRIQIILRADDGINATMRCVIGSVAYSILAVYPLDNTPHWMICALVRKEGL